MVESGAPRAARERQHVGAWRDWFAYRVDGLVRTVAFTAFFGVQVGIEQRLDRLRARLVPDFHRFEWTNSRYGSMAFLWGQAKLRGRHPTARPGSDELQL